MYTRNEKILPVHIEEELKDSYISYAMSVIVGRALPDAKDGLKPVHRRILYAMKELGLEHNKPYKKCARITGDCLGKYHPHGDMAVYDALVRMAQDFSMRYPLVDGQGNFGCFTKDTKVKIADGRQISFGELIDEHRQGKRNFAFVFNSNTQKVEIAEIKNPRKTRKKAELIKVVLDNDEEIRCTPDHPFMLRDGNYKKAKELKPGTILMTLDKSLNSINSSLRGSEVPEGGEATEAISSFQGDCFVVPPPSVARPLATTQATCLLEEEHAPNHKVKRVEFLAQREDVYDLTIDNWHNFALAYGVFVHNSVDGDSAASMRYTEARLAAISDEMLVDLEKDTVEFMPNFDESLKEPRILPAALPNLLVNGSSGIAVGMATNIPPQNLTEIADAIALIIDNPNAELKEITKIVKGPDFPTGGIICGRDGIKNAYQTGRGLLKIHAKANIESVKGGRERIVVSEIPYQVNKSNLISSIADLVQEKKLEGISDIRDESDKDGMRMIIELKRDANAQVVLNQLYKHTQMQETFGVIMLALVDNRPRVLTLRQALDIYIEHRKEIIIRRTKYDLKKAQDRAHILEGFKTAIANIDKIIALIKKAKGPDEAREQLEDKFDLSERQAQAILEMQLQRLTGLERDKIEAEYLELIKKIAYYKSLLESEKKILQVVKEEILQIKKKYGDERRTQIVAEVTDFDIEDLIAEEDVVITISHAGYIKRLPVSAYRKQRRGGRGVTGAETKEEDFIEHLFIASTHDFMLFFTNIGRVHWVKVHEIPQAGKVSKGKAIVNLLELQKDERVTAFIPVKEFKEGSFLIMVTKKGLIKKTDLKAYSNPRKGGIIGIGIEPGDELIQVLLTDGKQEILIATKNGKAIRFNESDVRDMGRAAKGVKGITLAKKDVVVGAQILKKDATILTVTINGFGKRTDMDEYRVQSRGGKGVINIKTSDRNGEAVSVLSVTDKDEIMLITEGGMIVRCPVKDIRATGRSTQGVRLMRFEAKDKVACVAPVVAEEEGEDEEGAKKRS